MLQFTCPQHRKPWRFHSCRLSGGRSFVHAGASLSRREQLLIRLTSSTDFRSLQLCRNANHFGTVLCRVVLALAVLHARISEQQCGTETDSIWISSSRHCWMKIVVACREEFGLAGCSRFEQTVYVFADTVAMQRPVRVMQMVQKTVAVPQVQSATGRASRSSQSFEYRERLDE